MLRLSDAPRGALRAAHRTVARALLAAEAERFGDAAPRLAETGAEGDPVLLGLPEREARRIAAMLEGVFGRALAPGLAEILPAGAEARALRPSGPDAAGAPGLDGPAEAALAELDARIAALPLAQCARREPLLRLHPRERPGLAGLRLALDAAALAAALGPALAGDADLLGHAAAVLAPRLLRALADPAARAEVLGSAPDGAAPLFVALPAEAARQAAALLGAAAAAPGLPRMVLMVPLAAVAAQPGGLSSLRAAAEGGAVAVALEGLDAEALGLLAPEAAVLAEAERLALRWSPRLAEDRAAGAALRRLDPARLLLLGCDGPEALEWGAAHGIACFGGPWIGLALAALRRLACPHAAGCALGACAARAAATEAAGRAGCANRPLLAALLPDRGFPA
ncbi:hypothetical protein [Caldovatus aquaticus]|uniref:Uncharacterized protein n=1 Tax=Caldovatus aquaticus TaxID=2865671 RepID=A0ABS7F0U0_9PROT|nr:hypothetical protein [Caldovatus aquaticus]MBW8269214.1 hypothetical protein [Caldovatus aquaticus]